MLGKVSQSGERFNREGIRIGKHVNQTETATAGWHRTRNGRFHQQQLESTIPTGTSMAEYTAGIGQYRASNVDSYYGPSQVMMEIQQTYPLVSSITV